MRGAPRKATQLVYEAPNSDQGEIDMAAKIVADNQVSVISISWGGCEPDTTQSSMTAVDNSFKQAAAQGISVYSASGRATRLARLHPLHQRRHRQVGGLPRLRTST